MTEYKYKIVKQNALNTDQYLIGMYESEIKAQNILINKESEGVRGELLVKPINPAEIVNPVSMDYSHYVWSMIPREEQKRVMGSDAAAEIDPNCLMCGGGTYYWLSLMIPKDFVVIDIGSSYGAQSYLFRHHKKYIAVDSFKPDFYGYHFENFKAEGTDFYNVTAGKFISGILPTLNLDIDKTFAICNYVPQWHNENASELVRKAFRNCYVFYPSE